MTSAVEPTTVAPAPYGAVLGPISAAHCVSHFYILMIAPLFGVIRADFGATYTELGLALVAFNVTSAVFATPAGYLVDRGNARSVLIGGLLIGSAAIAGAATVQSYWGFVAMFALLGLGNTAYHPADYSLLSRRIEPARMSQAYALHSFAGMVGSAAAPPCLLLLANAFGWRGAYLASAALGVAVAFMLVAFGGALATPPLRASSAARDGSETPPAANRRILFTTPIILNLIVFTLLAMMASGVTNFSVVALEAMRGTPLAVTNVALSAFLIASALGVLVGGYVAMRTSRHDVAANLCLAVFAVALLVVAFVDIHAAALIVLFSFAGLANGGIMPSRDMLVRAVTPPGAFGRVFGFVTNGFNIGGILTPLLFGWLMDHGSPRAVLVIAAVLSLVAIPLVMMSALQRRQVASAR